MSAERTIGNQNVEFIALVILHYLSAKLLE